MYLMVYVCGCQVVVIFIICVVGLLFLYMLFLLCLDPLMTRRPVAYTEQHNEQPEEVSMVSSTAEHFEIDSVYFHGKLLKICPISLKDHRGSLKNLLKILFIYLLHLFISVYYLLCHLV